MKKISLLPHIAAASICSILLGFSPSSFAATATNLVTICTSATTTIQASKCTAWQYNIYSPTAYIESYPQVSPGPKGYTDPLYEYRLGSSLTPTNGVKVCPTALTPGTSFNSPSADPCPNNVLVAASKILPTYSYAIATSSGGIMVYQINTSGVGLVTGSPFVPSPIPMNYTGVVAFPSPTLTALDPAGQYLYALYDPGYYVSEVIYSYKMVNGVPSQVSINSNFGGGDNPGGIYIMFATAQHLYLFDTCYRNIPCGSVLNTKNGVIANAGLSFSMPVDLFDTDSVISIAVDPQEQFLYMYLSSTGGTVSDTIAIYSLNFTTSTSTLVQIVMQSGQVLLGAQ
jgi:hypothetical protein